MATYSYVGHVVDVTVPNTDNYDITAYGGQGGAGDNTSGGKGAKILGQFHLTAGEKLEVIVGGAGASSSNGGGGGGGGSFVIETSTNGTDTVDIPLLVAGGGGGGGGAGGGGGFPGNAGAGAGTGTSGGGGSGSNAGGGGSSGAGGAGGTVIYTGGGGAGVNSAGGAGGGGFHGFGGANRTGGYAGGAHDAAADGGAGGFGGGGGGDYGGGGGGGYSGGGGGGYGGGTYGGGGGGGSLDTGTSKTLTASQHSGAGVVILTELCYLRGTRILTPTGEVYVEDLRIGDLIVTRFAAMQPVKWIGRQRHDTRFIRTDRDRIPVRVHAGALGDCLPARDLFVSPGHSMLVDGQLVLASALVNGVTITQDWCPAVLDYFQIDLGVHDCVIAEGTWSETYADGPGLREQFHNAAEFATLYPDHAPPDELSLCAPRPERGAKLDAVLRPVVARAAASLTPGPLRGFIDRIAAPWTVEGWANDSDHPELPVLLELVCADQVIATVLACDYRADLAEAGLGQGRCAFFLKSPVRLRPEMLASLRIRRASDHTEILMTPGCASGIEPARETPPVPRLRLVA